MIVRTNNVRILSFAAAVGKKEGEGPLKNRFDYIDTDDRFGMETWEKPRANARASPSRSPSPRRRSRPPTLIF